MRFLILTQNPSSGEWQVIANHREGCLPECIEHGFETVEAADAVLTKKLDDDKNLIGLIVQVHREYV